MEGWFSILCGSIAFALSLFLSLPTFVISFLNVVLKIHLAIQGAQIVIQIVNKLRNVQDSLRCANNYYPSPQLDPDSPAEANLLDGDDISRQPSVLDRTELCILDQQPEEIPFPALHSQRRSTLLGDTDRLIPAPSRGTSLVPWDGIINWAFEGASVFQHRVELFQALTNYKNLVSRDNPADRSFLLYGLKYCPAPTSRNAYRTVKIDIFDSCLNINHILYHLYFDDIYSATFAKTMHLTGSNTVIVVFVHQTDAIAFVKSHKGGLKIGPYLANVSLVNTPTYPIPNALYRNIMECGYSRRLLVCDNRSMLKAELEQFLKGSPCRDYTESIKSCTAEKGVFIQFHNIKMAVSAFDLLKHSPVFANSLARFKRAPIRQFTKQQWGSQPASEDGEWYFSG